jgi:hypothetical protein
MVCIDRRFDDGFAGLGESNIVSGVIAERPYPVNGSRCHPDICPSSRRRLI